MSPTYITLALLLVNQNIQTPSGIADFVWINYPVLGTLLFFYLILFIGDSWYPHSKQVSLK